MTPLSPTPSERRTSRQYESNGTYVGVGSVFSETLQRTIEGNFRITWDDRGTCDIAVTPINLDFLMTLVIVDEFDRFRDLTVTCRDGKFVAPRCYLNTTSLSAGVNGSNAELGFITLAGSFTPFVAKSGRYWDAPILNFLMNLRAAATDTPHPLQISTLFSDPLASTNVVGVPDVEARRRVVGFSFAGQPAFVEHLPDYEATEKMLKGGMEPIRATSLIVGSVPSDTDLGIDGIRQWFPADAILALTLATGTRVSLGFVELRDENGELSERFHLSFVHSPYFDGHFTITDPIHSNYAESGTGALMEAFLAAPEATMQRVRLLAETIETAQAALQTPEHAFAFIVRTLDGVANALGLTRRVLSDGLPAPEASEVKAVLVNARNRLQAIARRFRSPSDAPTVNAINRIASRAEQAAATEDSFGLSMSRLLQHYRFDDEAAIAAFYTLYPRLDGLTWAQTLDMYRGGVIHKGFLDYSTGVAMSDVVCYARHLIDMAIRICLREVQYQGTYNPFNMAAMQKSEVDWVTDAGSIGQFGFSGRRPKLMKRVGF